MERYGVAYALGAAALFGASTLAAKLLLRGISPLMLPALLYAGAAILLSAYRLIGSKSPESQIGRGDLIPIGGTFSLAASSGQY